MSKRHSYDAVVIGSGPNGLAAAITLARAGRSVIVFEARDTIGGGARTKELTLPGFLHDVCSAVHPLGAASPFFHSLPLEQHGLAWARPAIALAHPFDDDDAAILHQDLKVTARALDGDGARYIALMRPFIDG